MNAVGWRGPDCSEFDVGEMRAGMPVLAMLLLTLSNAGFMPAVVLALSRRHYAEALVYTYTMISSAVSLTLLDKYNYQQEFEKLFEHF